MENDGMDIVAQAIQYIAYGQFRLKNGTVITIAQPDGAATCEDGGFNE